MKRELTHGLVFVAGSGVFYALEQMSYNLNFLKGAYMGDYMGNYYGGYEGGY